MPFFKYALSNKFKAVLLWIRACSHILTKWDKVSSYVTNKRAIKKNRAFNAAAKKNQQ